MKPAPFAYEAPETLAEAQRILAEAGSDAKILAGGQSLVPLLNMRLARPELLVDINRVQMADTITEEGGRVHLGALVRHRAAETSAVVKSRLPLLAEAISQVGHIDIRNRGTVVGSLSHGDPVAEIPAVLMALDGEVEVLGTSGVRRVAAADFFVTYLTTALQADEVAQAVTFPSLPPATGTAFVEFARRHGDFAIVGVACQISLHPDGGIREARLALAGVADVPYRARGAEVELVSRGMGALPQAIAAVRDEIDPESDIHAPADYRRHLAGVLTERAVHLAARRARGEAA